MKASLPLLLFACYYVFIVSVHGENQAERLLSLLKLKATHRIKWKESTMNVRQDDDNDTVYLSRQNGLKNADKITRLPGQPNPVNFDQYAGYVTVSPRNERALFYYFVEASKNSSGLKNKPLVLWLNGGPGCSSLGTGAMSELGPFFVKRDGKTLYENAHAWNKIANILFLESPAGVGFSYSNTTTDYAKSGDRRTARDSYTFLINWLERFPEYKNRDFFIAGESYAGHYIPQLANLILKNNRNKSHTTIKLKGIAIGNAYVETGNNVKGIYEYYWSRSLISNETYNLIKSTCNFDVNEDSIDCEKDMNLADDEHGIIDYYNIYAPVCSDSDSRNFMHNGLGADPCSANYIKSYLNLPEVQKALHANNAKLSYQWVGCSDWNDSPESILPDIKKAIKSKLRVWLYSGDVDSVVPVTATQYSLKALGLPIKKKWTPWYHKGQVGGYYVGYNGLTFATVRGSGHMVPRDQPERALELFRAFLENKYPSGVSNV
ncbi:Peptidase S10 serine carboxypeptidase protein [Dioscorea alata]|uniref:Peptidase S10 serine carboxypeptidase protein n=1 Tax=Dioscorea alata TaxID=55571 RepID=A0ACB7U7J2_DIOAL|nr:Peptidase S10 serine carboxypeptidase protein [Dioscorea alata]